MKLWLAQHESENIIEVNEKDSRGLELMAACGFKWINRNDGLGWRPLSAVAAEVAIASQLKDIECQPQSD